MKPSEPLILVCAIFALCAPSPLAQSAAQAQAPESQAASAAAPPPCPLPPNLKLTPASNIFSPEQELELGDIEAERAEHEYHIVEDRELTAYINQVAQRIVAQLPPNDLHFQVAIYDSPDPNAFSVAGGRIYVSRKLIASMKNEDELAALIGHEMGHTLSHQQAADYSYLFDKVLGVKQVTTREDLQQKYNDLLSNAARKQSAYESLERHEEPEQYIADRISLYAVANAGFAAGALAEFWDRGAETHGKGASGLSEALGMSSPSQVRLGEMQRSLAALPPACQRKTGPPTADFLAWQSAVISYSAAGGYKESLAGVLSKKTLNPPLRGDLKNLRFSQDGKFVLAQDDASVYVLSHDPFKEIFRFDAPDAHDAIFTPDSKDVVFLTRSLRVEDWSIAGQSRVSAHEIVNESGCNTTAISPDGKHVGCVGNNRTLYVYDVESGNAIFTRKDFVVFSTNEMFALLINSMMSGGPLEFARMAFSPDGRYFVASHADPIGIDLSTGKSIPMHGALHGFSWGAVTFLTNDTLLIDNANNPADSVIAKFPSGQKVQKVILGANGIRSSPEGTYVFLSPVRDGAAGALDLKTNTFPVVVKSSPAAIDIFGSEFVLQGTAGQVGLLNLRDRQMKQKAELSLGPMGSVHAGAVSGDFKWLALSGETRGAVWNLDAMNRLYFLRGFRGAYFDGDAAMFAHFDKHNDSPQTIGRASLSQVAVTPGATIGKDDAVQQCGPFLIMRTQTDTKAYDAVLKVRDVRTGSELWSATFKESPDLRSDDANNRITLRWSPDSSVAKEAAKSDAALAARRNAVRDRILGEFVQVRELSTGKILGSIVIDTGKGSFRVENWYAAGDWLFVTDRGGRTLAYSISSGEQKGVVFGDSPMASLQAGLLIVKPSDGQMQFYSLADLKKLGRAQFPSRIALARFNADGSRMFVLTRDQNAYVFDSKALANSVSAPAAASTAPVAAPAVAAAH